MIDVNELPHIDTLKDIESNFKIYAGPGAGKTTWLSSHLERVQKKSKRLGKTGQIGCITYTNVAADEIIDRLECDQTRFDISTIHSFLYRNIVKPFSYLIETDLDGNDLFNISKLNGHDEHFVHGSRLSRWVNTINKNNKNYWYLLSPNNRDDVATELTSLNYEIEGKEVQLSINQHRGARIPRSNGELWEYKLKYWSDGIMHHEDVLYFSYLIINKSEEVLKFIQTKFPYIFVDEFQDTTQLQTWILDKIAEQGTKIGIVGDLGQSIYKFAGAVRTDFIEFKEGEISSFKLDHNHRSSHKITDFLNELRNDINQSYGDDTGEGSTVKVLIGSIDLAKKWFNQNHPDKILYILTRSNASVSTFKGHLGITTDDKINEMYANDSNGHRSKLIHSILKGVKYREKHDFNNSIKEVLRPLKRIGRDELRELDLRKIAIEILDNLSVKEKRKQSVYNFYMELKSRISEEYNLKIGAALNSGNAKTFYENNTLTELLPYVKVDTKSDDRIRTIHSAKGTEFKNTLVHFDTIEDFRNYILNAPSYINASEDDGRIYYVACSRAENNLFINIPEATPEDVELIESMNLEPISV
ncbi:ATP-dependent helicase [Aliifodinibius sp. S!AR15-10]|uniref:ATP-dependent helicase n=1 Tax=Aliifodinibius sp. S!AR15-10 TaxID=2950437 RepID=UPI00285480D4|nr:ATP-dependent helicase [Aliifodinibius sp. S!AR15-10]MDR8389828.1 ATP-dependent helicase [Aliifodinibius sp. S!AR15-10]